ARIGCLKNILRPRKFTLHMKTCEIKRTMSEDVDFRGLVGLLDAELWQRYPQEQSQHDPFNKIENNHTVLVVYRDGMPAGCGCFKTFDTSTVEIKRMFVHPRHRGHGLGFTIIDNLEQWACELGYSRAILETGPNQPEAIRLYQKSGYSRISNYGPYVGMERSICMQKLLFPSGRS
ncbi:MAG TPA: GNAT family N-acetyltransferase, partial [Chryseosolibacter sp.]|nr:GNAT family N-acetyltransferase [Chryseosolibacter sp.]